MSHVRLTLSKEMLQALLTNLHDLRSLAGEFIVENEIEGNNEVIRVINLVTGDVFEQTIQKQEIQTDLNGGCKIYKFPLKIKEKQKADEE